MTSCIASARRRFWAPARCVDGACSLDGRPVCGFAARRFSRQLKIYRPAALKLKIYRPAALKLKYRRRVLLLWGCPWCAKKDGRF